MAAPRPRLAPSHAPPTAGSTPGEAVPNNLPAQVTAFVGRESLIDAVRARLLRPDVRLLTLTGPGGTGKTRLALQAAGDVLDQFPDGVFFVELASLSDPDLVAPAIAQVVGLKETSGRPPLEALISALRQRRMLLVLDNFEHLLASPPHGSAPPVPAPARALSRTPARGVATDAAALMGAAPLLKVLVTSRAPLRLYGEHELPVPPLALPDRRAAPTAEHVAQFEAVRLFAERAQAARPDFGVGDENAGTVAEVCRRLDGLPLAIELAAARLRALPVAALLARLERRLPLLTGGARDLPARQQTLRDTIGWSYDLLGPREQTLFRRLAVFRGCTLDAVEAVCAGTPAATTGAAFPPLAGDALDGVTALVEQSLLKREETPDGQPWYIMLETVREFAWEQAAGAGEAAALRRRHAAYYAELADEAAAALHGPDQLLWLRRLLDEQDNLRAALEWATSGAKDGAADAGAAGLRLAGALEWYWALTAQLDEGRGWLERALVHDAAEGGDARSVHAGQALLRADALGAAGYLAHLRNDFAAARRFHEESLALYRREGDPRATGRAAAKLAFAALHQGDLETAERLGREGLTLCRAGGDAWCIGFTQCIVGGLMLRSGDLDGAAEAAKESLARFRECGDRWGIAWALHAVGQVALHRGQLAPAAARYQERLALCRELGNKTAEAHALDVLGTIARLEGELERAEALFQQSLALRREWSEWDRPSVAYLLAALAGTALGQRRRAAARERVWEGLAALREAPDVEDQPSRSALAALLEAGVELCVLEGVAAAALRLAGTARWLREAARAPLPAPERERLDRALAPAREELGTAGEAEAYATSLSGQQALDLAEEVLRTEGAGCAREAPVQRGDGALSPREQEVAALIARGYTNRRIAQALVITEGTAASHVVHILDKLGFKSRAQVAVWAAEHGLHRPPAA